MLHFEVKSFDELTKAELYELLQLRAEVFVVEQDCPYQDLDGKDVRALHVLGKLGGTLVAYTRCFPPGAYFEEASIGRVVVRPSSRKKNYGIQLMEHSIAVVKEHFATSLIRISAQCYLLEFYGSLGFQTDSGEYLEDGIPHKSMVYGKNNKI
ncbi:MAG: GNAT family N-acetyltransferase [Capnocytophaga sp.]|nr:GNAT family N-acetyltransferase [Capnocytophaga sp.]